MKSLTALLLFCFSLTACLSPGDARSLGFEQGLRGEGYARILGRNADEHRQGWSEGNAQYCRTLSYPALARSLGRLPSGICSFSDAELRQYCQNVDYAAFGRADQDLPSACLPSSSQQTAFRQARVATFCTASFGQSDTRSAANRLWSFGACSPGSERRSCERSSAIANAARPYCEGSRDYAAGVETIVLRAQRSSVSDATDELIDLASLEAPSPEQVERRVQLGDYLDWAGDCDVRGYFMDC